MPLNTMFANKSFLARSPPFLIGLAVCVSLNVASVAAELQFKPVRPELETYVQSIGYHSIRLVRAAGPMRLDAPMEVAGNRCLFLVDTGWSMTCIAKRLSASLRWLSAAELQLLLGTDPKSRTNFVLLDVFQVGSISFANQPAEIVDPRIKGWGNLADGVLGADFFLRHYCLIDCLDRRLYVRRDKSPATVQSALETSLKQSGFVAVKLLPTKELLELCEAEVNGLGTTLVVDTGAFWSSLDEGEVKRLKLKAHLTYYSSGGVGKIGTHPFSATKLDSLKLDGIDVTDREFQFGVQDLSAWGLGKNGKTMPGTQGVLGMDQLLLNGALIDVAGKKMWLKPIKGKRNPEAIESIK